MYLYIIIDSKDSSMSLWRNVDNAITEHLRITEDAVITKCEAPIIAMCIQIEISPLK